MPQSVRLTYSDLHTGGTSNKEYRVSMVPEGRLFHVVAFFGKIGGTLAEARKTTEPVPFDEASDIFNRTVEEKARKGYVLDNDKSPAPEVLGIGQHKAVNKIREITSRPRTPYPIEDLAEISSQQEAEVLLRQARYWLQMKNDGRFAQFQKRSDGSYTHYNKLGETVGNMPAEVLAELKRLKAKTFFIAGELIGVRFVAENLLELDGVDYSKRSYAERFTELEGLVLAESRHVTLTATWFKLADKLQGYQAIRGRRGEGIVLKLSSAVYKAGDSGQHLKFKFVKSLSAVVIRTGDKGHNSATIGLYDGGKLREVGHVSLNGKPKVKINDVIEVEYLYGSEGSRLVQARMANLGVRKDVTPKECTFDQIIYQGAVA